MPRAEPPFPQAGVRRTVAEKQEYFFPEDKMIGWHHQLNGHEFEQILGDNEGQGRLVCCSPQGCKELETTQQGNNHNRFYYL